MNFSTLSRTALLATALLALAAFPSRAADVEDTKGPAISVLKATKACFSNIVEVSGTILARDEPQTSSQAPTTGHCSIRLLNGRLMTRRKKG